MPIIKLETKIIAPQEVVFDLARSIDLHQLSAADTNEEAIAGKKTGLLDLGEEVTWRAKHFGIYQKLTSKMVAIEFPHFFVDEMTKGIFKSFTHRHEFIQHGNVTTMKDIFRYRAPLGPIGNIADTLFLKAYMTRFLIKRNLVIKQFSEMDHDKLAKNL